MTTLTQDKSIIQDFLEKPFSKRTFAESLFENGRGDIGAIDNETLDFMQLEDYINEENENTIYFHEALVGNDLKLPEPSKDQVYVTGNSRVNGARTDASSPLTTHLNSVNSDPSPSLVHAVSSSSLHSSPITVSTVVGKADTFRGRNSIAGSSFSKPHHLPDSPPDSGSEPPFSPPNEDPKLNSASAAPEMLQQAPLDSLKHYMSYGHTQPLKHLPEVSSSAHHLPHVTAVPVTVQSPHSTSLPLLTVGQPHSPAGQLLSQLPQTILAPLVGNNLQPQQTLVTSGHLGNLYSSGEEFLYDNLAASPTSTSSASKKRKLSDSPKTSRSYINGIVHVKTEPAVNSPDPVHSSSVLPSGDEDYNFDLGAADSAGLFLDANYQCIRFQPFQQNTWVQLLDRDMKEIPPPNFRVDADKGFNYSNADESFVCQKKNHFQVTVHVQPVCDAHYIRTPEGTKPIEKFTLDFHGVKMESPTQTIKVEQSQSDRSKKPFHPVPLQLVTDQVTKTTVGRLHFSETTSNNMRKKGKPNPDQRFFFLVVSLCAHVSGDITYPVISHASEKIIVRASNPGQFENDMELTWQKGHTSDSIFHAGRVGINTDRPEESLVVHGNIKVTGHIVQPSDIRAKVDIQELDTREQLKNVASMRIVRYKYLPEFGHHVGVTQMSDAGVIAQEVQHILPEAVLEAGDVRLSDGRLIDKLLVVNKERIFMENVGAVKELCKVTDNLENRIDELERINRKLSSMKRKDSWKSTSTDLSRSSGSSTSYSKKKNRSRQAKNRFSNSMACSSRFVQAVIVILVLVMAFCLVSMATLYIMEWRNRHSAPQFPKVSTFPTKSTYSLSSSTATNDQPTSSYRVLPKSGSPSTVSSLPREFTDGSTKDEFSSRMTHASSTTEQELENAETVLGEPAGCNSPDSCPVFCCESRNRMALEEIEAVGNDFNSHNHVERKRSGFLSTHEELHSESSRTSQVSELPLPSTPVIFEERGKTNKGNEEGGRRRNLIERIKRIYKRGLAENAQFQKPDAAKEEWTFPLVHLVELNVTLTSNMCTKQRNGLSSGRFVCEVKLSRHFPMSNITLQISSANQMNLELCESNEDTSCSQQNVLDQKYVSEVRKREVFPQVHSWELPAGLYFKSSYRFRLISWNLLPADSHLCNLSEDQHAFTEYVVKFQRQCDK